MKENASCEEWADELVEPRHFAKKSNEFEDYDLDKSIEILKNIYSKYYYEKGKSKK